MRPRLLSPTALLSGAFTFALLFVHAGVARAVVPHLIDLFQTAPRLAMLGFLALVTFPASATFVAHRFGSRFLDRFASVAGSGRVIVWAGALVWMVTYATSILTRILFLVINPPKPEPDAFSLGNEVMSMLEQLSPANTISIFAGLWLFVSSVLFEIEQRSRTRS